MPAIEAKIDVRPASVDASAAAMRVTAATLKS